MPSDLAALQITIEETEELVDFNPRTTLALDVYRAFVLRRTKPFFSVLFTEFFALGLLLIFVVPVTLIVLRNSGKFPQGITSIILLFTILLGFCFLVVLAGNVYLWKQAKQMKSLVKLLEEVDKYNEVIKTVSFMDEIESVGKSNLQRDRTNPRKEVIEALNVTRESLIAALKVERIIRKHDGCIERRYQLLANLENNLNAVMSFDASDRASEYGRLLNESLQIGMSVHKEMRKLQNG